MKSTADIVIVGGGVMGVSIAYHLAAAGVKDVLLIEKRFVGAGSSGKSGAIIRQHYSHEVTSAMALRSLRFFERFQEATGREARFRQVGFLMLAAEADRDALQGNVDLQRSVGVNTRVLATEELAELDPRADFGGAVAAFEPEGGWVNPLAVLHGFTRRAVELGAEVREGAAVQSIRHRGGVVEAVETDQGEVATRQVVLAAGPWSNRVARASGFELPLEVIRPEIAFVARPEDFGPDHPVVGDLPNGVYYRPDDGARTLIGAIDNSQDEVVADPDEYEEGASDTFIRWAHAALARRYPALERGFRRGGYSALYTCTPDFQPIIDEAPGLGGLLVVTGFSGHGFKLSPAVGEAVAEQILHGRTTASQIELFRAARFDEGQRIESRYGYGVIA